jgi:hypothetical protein
MDFNIKNTKKWTTNCIEPDKTAQIPRLVLVSGSILRWHSRLRVKVVSDAKWP